MDPPAPGSATTEDRRTTCQERTEQLDDNVGCSGCFRKAQPGIIGPGAGHLEREMRLVTPGDIADHRGTLVLSQGQESISRGQFALDQPVLTLVGDLPV